MSNYYIKYIWGPAGQRGYPGNSDNLIHFAGGQKEPCNRFKDCDSFFIYETGRKEGNKTGAKAIYARGVIDADQLVSVREEFGRGKRWQYAVKVCLQKKVNPLNGVPLKRIEEIIEKKIRRQRGGLLKITEGQFKKLNSELENCS